MWKGFSKRYYSTELAISILTLNFIALKSYLVNIDFSYLIQSLKYLKMSNKESNVIFKWAKLGLKTNR